jgi:hypothetical protein
MQHSARSPDALSATVPSKSSSNPIQFKIKNELCFSFYVSTSCHSVKSPKLFFWKYEQQINNINTTYTYLWIMKESINSSGVPTTRLARNTWFANVTGEAVQFGYKNYMKMA